MVFSVLASKRPHSTLQRERRLRWQWRKFQRTWFFSFNDGMVLIKGHVSFAIANIKPKPHVRLGLDDHSSIYIFSAIFFAI